MMRGRVAWLGACAVAFALGCGGGGGTPAGSERGPCYPNGGCDLGLTCASDLCVRVETDGGGRGGGNMGAGGGGAGGMGGATGTAGTFAVAPHPPQPQIANLGGPVLTAPKVLPIFFTGDPDRLEVQQFLDEVGSGNYWRATTSEYGVGPISLRPAVTSTSPPSSSISDDALQAEIATNTASASAPWGAADPNTIYLFVIPPTVTLTISTEICCTSFGGYHIETTTVNGVTVPYVAACSCPNLLGPGWSPVDERTAAISHELIEAATDPFPRSDPAYTGANQANVVWTVVTGGELTDMCVVQPDAYGRVPGSSWVVSKSWSNAAALAGNDPCVPASTSIPYFNSMPVLDLVPYGYNSPYVTRGLTIPIGTSRTIDLDLFSTGVVPQDWTVDVFSYEEYFGGTPSLSFALNKASGRNGDVLRLTITALRTNPILGVDPFIVLSSYGAPDQIDFRGHVAMGLVFTN